MDELEAYLVEHTDEGELDSSGEFTMDRDKALAKLSQFQLPGDHHWALKLVQAVVAGGALALEIRLTLTGSQFSFDDLWTLDELEAAFYDTDLSGLSLRDCSERTERERAAMEALAPTVKSLTLDLQEKIAEERAGSRGLGALGLGMGGLFLGLGAFFCLPVPAVLGLAVGGPGVRTLLNQGSVMLGIRQELRLSLLGLQQLWPDGLVGNPLDEMAIRLPKTSVRLVSAPQQGETRQPKWRRRRGQ